MKLTGVWLCASLGVAASSAAAADKVRFGTNWLAEAEHGGYYQAVADGSTSKSCRAARRRPMESC
jgi:NitT/TauT family transport system substrate-binding protein